MDFKYIMIPAFQAENLGLLENRILVNDEKDVIVNQTDLMSYGLLEDSVEDKATRLGGKVITADLARQLIATAKN